MRRNSAPLSLAAAAAMLILTVLTGCAPDNVFFRVRNRSGETLHDVVISYPGDTLTIKTLNNMTDLGIFRHFNGPGALSVTYSTEDGRTHTTSGPQVTGNEKGDVSVTCDGSDASFDTKFEPNPQ